MLFIASLIGLVFVFGIIMIIGWLTAWNMMGEFKDKNSTMIQKFCDATNIISVLFVSIQKFVLDPRSRRVRKSLSESIDDAGELIDRLVGNSANSRVYNGKDGKSFGIMFSNIFKRKVKVYGSRMTEEEKIRRLDKLNLSIGKLIGGSTLTNILNQIDNALIKEPELNIGNLIIRAVNSLTLSLGAGFE